MAALGSLLVNAMGQGSASSRTQGMSPQNLFNAITSTFLRAREGNLSVLGDPAFMDGRAWRNQEPQCDHGQEQPRQQLQPWQQQDQGIGMPKTLRELNDVIAQKMMAADASTQRYCNSRSQEQIKNHECPNIGDLPRFKGVKGVHATLTNVRYLPPEAMMKLTSRYPTVAAAMIAVREWLVCRFCKLSQSGIPYLGRLCIACMSAVSFKGCGNFCGACWKLDRHSPEFVLKLLRQLVRKKHACGLSSLLFELRTYFSHLNGQCENRYDFFLHAKHCGPNRVSVRIVIEFVFTKDVTRRAVPIKKGHIFHMEDDGALGDGRQRSDRVTVLIICRSVNKVVDRVQMVLLRCWIDAILCLAPEMLTTFVYVLTLNGTYLDQTHRYLRNGTHLPPNAYPCDTRDPQNLREQRLVSLRGRDDHGSEACWGEAPQVVDRFGYGRGGEREACEYRYCLVPDERDRIENALGKDMRNLVLGFNPRILLLQDARGPELAVEEHAIWKKHSAVVLEQIKARDLRRAQNRAAGRSRSAQEDDMDREDDWAEAERAADRDDADREPDSEQEESDSDPASGPSSGRASGRASGSGSAAARAGVRAQGEPSWGAVQEECEDQAAGPVADSAAARAARAVARADKGVADDLDQEGDDEAWAEEATAERRQTSRDLVKANRGRNRQELEPAPTRFFKNGRPKKMQHAKPPAGKRGSDGGWAQAAQPVGPEPTMGMNMVQQLEHYREIDDGSDRRARSRA